MLLCEILQLTFNIWKWRIFGIVVKHKQNETAPTSATPRASWYVEYYFLSVYFLFVICASKIVVEFKKKSNRCSFLLTCDLCRKNSRWNTRKIKSMFIFISQRLKQAIVCMSLVHGHSIPQIIVCNTDTQIDVMVNVAVSQRKSLHIHLSNNRLIDIVKIMKRNEFESTIVFYSIFNCQLTNICFYHLIMWLIGQRTCMQYLRPNVHGTYKQK